MKKHVALLVGLSMSCAGALAGSVEGPYVIWYNMAARPALVDQQVRQYLNSQAAKDKCFDNGAILFMRDKPAIPAELIAAALYGQEQTAIKRLSALLKKPFKDMDEGFDGIVVYADNGKARLYSLTTGARKVVKRDTGMTNVADALCSVMPMITRAP